MGKDEISQSQYLFTSEACGIITDLLEGAETLAEVLNSESDGIINLLFKEKHQTGHSEQNITDLENLYSLSGDYLRTFEECIDFYGLRNIPGGPKVMRKTRHKISNIEDIQTIPGNKLLEHMSKRAVMDLIEHDYLEKIEKHQDIKDFLSTIFCGTNNQDAHIGLLEFLEGWVPGFGDYSDIDGMLDYIQSDYPYTYDVWKDLSLKSEPLNGSEMRDNRTRLLNILEFIEAPKHLKEPKQ